MRKGLVRGTLVLLLMLSVVTLGICAGNSEKPAATGARKYTVGVSNFSVGNSYRVQMIENIRQKYLKLKQDGVMDNLIITNSNMDVNKQIADVKDLITQKVDAILITALSSAALSPVCEDAISKGIVVVSFNSQVDSDKITSKVVEDEYLFGQIGGEWLVKALGGKGNIIILSGIAGNDTNELRAQGAKDAFNKSPGIKILGEGFGEWDYAKGKVAVENLLAANPQIDGVYSQGGAMTLAAVDAFIEAGRPLVPMTGESNNGFLKAWKKYSGKDKFDSVAPIVRDNTGAIALETAIKALKGETVQKITKLQREVITSADIDKYVKMDLPDSFWCGSDLPDDVVKQLFTK
jgi:ribose transport system substrate-binding protein